MEEIWKPIKGFEGRYEVSNLGNVKSLDRTTSGKNNGVRLIKGKLLKQQIASGYAQVYLSEKGKQRWFKVHRLVAEAFVANPNNLPIVNHKDGNTLNNIEANIEWCDTRYNVIYGIILRNGLNISVKEYTNSNNRKQNKYSRDYYEKHKSYFKEYYIKNRDKILKKYHENRIS